MDKGWQDCLVIKVLGVQVKGPEFNPRNLHKNTKHSEAYLRSQCWGRGDRQPVLPNW